MGAEQARAGVLAIERIGSRILLVRGHKVLLDADLATLYGVSTKRFNEQVRRNAARFRRTSRSGSRPKNGIL